MNKLFIPALASMVFASAAFAAPQDNTVIYGGKATSSIQLSAAVSVPAAPVAMGESYPDSTAAFVSTKTRAQVQAELLQAIKDGTYRSHNEVE